MEEAQYHFTSRALSRMNRDRGVLVPLDAPDTAAEGLKADQSRIEHFRRDSFVGTGPEVMTRIEELKTRVGVDEMAVVTWTRRQGHQTGELHRARPRQRLRAEILAIAPRSSSPEKASAEVLNGRPSRWRAHDLPRACWRSPSTAFRSAGTSTVQTP